MADEIIKLIEYIVNSDIAKGAIVAYVIFTVIFVAVVIAIFAITFRQILKHNRRK